MKVTTKVPTVTASFESLRISLVELGAKRLIHRAHIKALQRSEINDGTGVVHRWMQENYADSMLIGLRRILDNTKGSFSLIRLLRYVQSNRDFHTVDNFIHVCESQHGYDDWYARALYARYSSDGCTLDRQRIKDDIKTVLAGSDGVLRYVNTVVAHQAANSNSTTPSTAITWEDLDRLFDEITGLFNKYYDLVKPGVTSISIPCCPQAFIGRSREWSMTIEVTG